MGVGEFFAGIVVIGLVALVGLGIMHLRLGR